MHISVLADETINGLDIQKGDVIVDGTLGGGGHSEIICKQFGRNITLIGIDADEEAIERSEIRLVAAGCTPYLVHGNFKDISEVLKKLAVVKIDKVLLDLGISSFQLDDSGRGFSFKRDEPLLMTMQKHLGKDTTTAYDVVNSWEESSLTDIFKGYGEERYAYRIAKKIGEVRKIKPIETTNELVEVIRSAVPKSYTHLKTHFATRTFQAIRIAVNNELETLKEALIAYFEHLSSGGRIAVISFHSLEDRIVKNYFRDLEKSGLAKNIVKKPIVPTDEEIKQNPRSRSAKLRIIQKI